MRSWSGAVDVGESYEQAAARELAEELGIRGLLRLLNTFINRSGLSPRIELDDPVAGRPCL
jgi:8-oxo-dGTP pyrophosphatase MutT (NUDIX family)